MSWAVQFYRTIIAYAVVCARSAARPLYSGVSGGRRLHGLPVQHQLGQWPDVLVEARRAVRGSERPSARGVPAATRIPRWAATARWVSTRRWRCTRSRRRGRPTAHSATPTCGRCTLPQRKAICVGGYTERQGQLLYPQMDLAPLRNYLKILDP